MNRIVLDKALLALIAVLASAVKTVIELKDKVEDLVEDARGLGEDVEDLVEDAQDDLESLWEKLQGVFERDPARLMKKADRLVSRGNELLNDDKPGNDKRGRRKLRRAHDLYDAADTIRRRAG